MVEGKRSRVEKLLGFCSKSSIFCCNSNSRPRKTDNLTTISNPHRISYLLFLNFANSKVHRLVFPAFGSYFCLSKTFTFPRTLRHAEHQTLALSISTVKLFFFSGPRIRIIAEDKVRIADCERIISFSGPRIRITAEY